MPIRYSQTQEQGFETRTYQPRDRPKGDQTWGKSQLSVPVLVRIRNGEVDDAEEKRVPDMTKLEALSVPPNFSMHSCFFLVLSLLFFFSRIWI